MSELLETTENIAGDRAKSGTAAMAEQASPSAECDAGWLMLNKREQQALCEILISSKSFTGISKQRLLRILRKRDPEHLGMFLRKVNQVLGDALRVIYDEEADRCLALTRASADWVQEMLDDHHLALLLFCFYLGMTSRTGNITFDELHQHLQRSSLYAERKLLAALDHLVKCGFLRQEEYGGENEEKKRLYRLTTAAKHAFPPRYLMRVLSETQGGEVTLEQVRDFFALDRPEQSGGETAGDTREIRLF
ncbi:MAG: hypothetical protein ACUVTU_09490 [Desulfurispora sp.]|uniref:hypothetical protein n=1 Tax=Desulfurispora sp. TaxID=3014275 RepID=UPI00404A652C